MMDRRHHATHREHVSKDNGVDAGLLWISTFVLGCVATLTADFGPLAAVITLLLGVPLLIRRPHLVAVSGLLTGFGGLWTYFLVRVLASGGNQDNATFWLAVGLIPLLVGLTLLLFIARRGLAHGSAVQR
jgi:hypothetical protein